MATEETVEENLPPLSWLRRRFERDIPQFASWEAYVTPVEAAGGEGAIGDAKIWLDTHVNRYIISAKAREDGSTYLGCTSKSRTWRPGEDWHRGNDLPDGPMTDETWWEILGAIIGFELQRSQARKGPEG